jgi:L-alanine-DL-glutamate epimerase-like enolase superfamily enzyme
MKITRIRIYRPRRPNPHFQQSDMVVTVETDAGFTGIGEGGSRDTLEQCAAMLIGEDPQRIQHLWQTMYRGYFYPAGREKLHALGALDLALWDILGKRLNAPVYAFWWLTRLCGCYATGYLAGSQAEYQGLHTPVSELTTSVADPGDGVFNARRRWTRRWTCRQVAATLGGKADGPSTSIPPGPGGRRAAVQPGPFNPSW